VSGNEQSPLDEKPNEVANDLGQMWPHEHNAGEQGLTDEHKRHPNHDLAQAIYERLTQLSLPGPGSGSVLAQWINRVRRTPSVRRKKHGVVVSNISLANYRGASLPVETPIAEQVIMALDEIEREVEHCSRVLSVTYLVVWRRQSTTTSPALLKT